MEITLKQYRAWIESTINVLKKRFNNLTAQELHNLACNIVDGIVEIENLAKEK